MPWTRNNTLIAYEYKCIIIILTGGFSRPAFKDIFLPYTSNEGGKDDETLEKTQPAYTIFKTYSHFASGRDESAQMWPDQFFTPLFDQGA